MIWRDEDAEGMAGWIGEHVQRFTNIAGSIEQQRGAEREGPVALLGQGGDVRDGEVEMKLLWNVGIGPRRRRKLTDRLDGQARLAGPITQHEPICAVRVGLARGRRLVAGP